VTCGRALLISLKINFVQYIYIYIYIYTVCLRFISIIIPTTIKFTTQPLQLSSSIHGTFKVFPSFSNPIYKLPLKQPKKLFKMSSPVVATAPSFDFKSFIGQSQVGPNSPEVQETMEKIQTIIKEYATGEREIPAFAAGLSDEEKEAKVAQLKTLLAGLSSKIPTPPQFTAPQIPQPKFDLEALKAQIPADFDLAKFKTENPDFDFEAIKAKIAGSKAPAVTTTEITIPRPPKDFDVTAIIEKAKALIEAKAAGGLPEGFTLPTIPKNISIKFAPEETAAPQLPAGVSPELIEKVKAMIAARQAEGGEGPKIPESPEAEAAIAKVKVALAELAEDSSFTSLSLPEKIKIIAGKVQN
jgi:hypothetical protein